MKRTCTRRQVEGLVERTGEGYGADRTTYNIVNIFDEGFLPSLRPNFPVCLFPSSRNFKFLGCTNSKKSKI